MPADPQWLRLFDSGEAEHVCELVQADIKAQAIEGYLPRLHLSLRKILMGELDSYIIATNGLNSRSIPDRNRIDIEAATNLYEFVDGLAERIEKRKGRSSDASQLRKLWIEFIAMGSGHRMYHDIPIENAAKEKRAVNARNAAKEPRKRRQKLPSADELRAQIEVVATKKGKRNAVSVIAKGAGVTPSAVRKRLKKKSAT